MNFLNLNKTVPYVRKKGIAGYFQLIFHNFFDLVLLNFLCLLTSLPILTFGASYKALISVCNKYAEDENVYPVREYFYNFKKEFFKSSLYGIFFEVTFVIIGFSSYFYLSIAKDSFIFYIFSLIGSVCLLILIMMAGWFFPIFCKIQQDFKSLITNSFILTFYHLKNSFCYLLVVLVCIILIFAFFPYSIPFVAIFPFVLTALASSCATAEKINKVFKIK